MSEKLIFKCFQKPQISTCLNKTLCDDISILVLFRKVLLKWVGVPDFLEGAGGKIRLNVEKLSFFHDLSKECFQFVPDTFGCPFYIIFSQANPLQSQKAPRNLENMYF